MDRLGAPERVCSVQTRFQFLDNGGSIMARSIGEAFVTSDVDQVVLKQVLTDALANRP